MGIQWPSSPGLNTPVVTISPSLGKSLKHQRGKNTNCGERGACCEGDPNTWEVRNTNISASCPSERIGLRERVRSCAVISGLSLETCCATFEGELFRQPPKCKSLIERNEVLTRRSWRLPQYQRLLVKSTVGRFGLPNRLAEQEKAETRVKKNPANEPKRSCAGTGNGAVVFLLFF